MSKSNFKKVEDEPENKYSKQADLRPELLKNILDMFK